MPIVIFRDVSLEKNIAILFDHCAVNCPHRRYAVRAGLAFASP
jgi:hypothetical protein